RRRLGQVLDGLVVLLELELGVAEVVPRPDVVLVELAGARERLDRVVVVVRRELGAALRVPRLARQRRELRALLRRRDREAALAVGDVEPRQLDVRLRALL